MNMNSKYMQKLSVVLLASWTSMATNAKAQSIGAPIVIAQIADVRNLVNYILGVIMLIIFVFGVVKVVKGVSEINGGQKDEGIMTVFTGAGMAVAPFIVWGVWIVLGFDNAGVGPADIRFEE